jgi:hypothetical protein
LKEIAIVILNWNGRELLEKFLPKVIQHSETAKIIIADNASSDDSIEFIRTSFPTIQIISNSSNSGYAKGYNDVLKKIEAKYYLLLNNDVEVTHGWLEPLLNKIKDPEVAGCQPKILSHDNKQYFEYAGASGGFLDKNYFPFCRGRILNRLEKDVGQYDGCVEVFWTSGACFLIRSELFHKVGGFDEDFFAHMEEIDLCWRLKKLNYKFMVVPDSIVYHVGGGSLSYDSPRKVYLNFRNSLIMTAKNHKGWIGFKLSQRLVIDGIAGMKYLLRGEFRNFGAVIKAHFSHHFNIYRTLKKRKSIKRSTTKFNSAGLFRASILWSFYFRGAKQFSKLNQRFFK